MKEYISMTLGSVSDHALPSHLLYIITQFHLISIEIIELIRLLSMRFHCNEILSDEQV